MAILSPRSVGEPVKALQRKLFELGRDTGGIDGHYGPATRRAVRQFQENSNLQVDGIAGPDTLRALEIADEVEDLLKKLPVSRGSAAIGGSVAGNIIVTGDRNVAVGPSGNIVGRDVVIDIASHNKVLSQDQAFERIGAAVRLNLDQLELNSEKSRIESSQFFKLTLIFASLGFLIVLAGVGLLLIGQVTAGIVSSIAGVIPEVTATLFFKKDKELRVTIERYHQHAIDSQRLLTMIDVAETMQDEKERDQIKKEIIFKALQIDNSVPIDAPPG